MDNLLVLKVNKKYFNFIKSDKKKVEGRINDEKRQKIKLGQLVRVINADDEKAEPIYSIIQYKHEYPSFKEMLITEGLKNVLPNVKSVEEGVKLYYSFPNYEKEESKYGVVALGLQNLGEFKDYDN